MTDKLAPNKLACITSDGGCCPFCLSKNISGEDTVIMDEVTRKCTCGDCATIYHEILRVCDVVNSDFSPIDPPITVDLHTYPSLGWLKLVNVNPDDVGPGSEPDMSFLGPFKDWDSDETKKTVQSIWRENGATFAYHVFINVVTGNLESIPLEPIPEKLEIQYTVPPGIKSRWF